MHRPDFSKLLLSGKGDRADPIEARTAQRPVAERSALHFGTLSARIATILAVMFGLLVCTLVLLFTAGVLRIDAEVIGGTVAEFGLLLIVIGIAELVLVLGLGVALARTITRPLADLVRATRNLARGRKTRVSVQSGD